MKQMLQMQSDCDAEKAKLNAKINELTVSLDRAKSHIYDKDQTINELKTSTRPLVREYIALKSRQNQQQINVLKS